MLSLIPDAESTIGEYLREQEDVAALGARIGTKIPSNPRKPWVRITQLDGQAVAGSRPDYLIDSLLQLDCYAGGEAMDAHTGHAEASRIARTVRAALYAAIGARLANDVVISGVNFTQFARMPDEAFEPARERYVLSATVVLHT